MKKRLGVIVIAFATSFVLMSLGAFYAIERFSTYATFSNLMDHSNNVLQYIYDVEKDLRDIDRAERGYMLTRDTMYLRFVNTAVVNIRSHLDTLRVITKENADQQKRIQFLAGGVALRVNALRRNMMYVDSTKSSSLSDYYYQSRQLMLDCSQQLRGIHAQEVAVKSAHLQKERQYETLTAHSLTLMIIISSLLTLVLFIVMVKELMARLKYQQELQARIVDLKRSHTELQEIAYVASHDLQEPLRKIQIFSDMLLYGRSSQNDASLDENLQRINKSASRMQSLIKDLVNLTSLIKIDEKKAPADLNRMLHFILLEMEVKINERCAKIDVRLLPDLMGYEQQLRILFTELLENALKFSKKDCAPVVTISCHMVNGVELEPINPNLQTKKFHRIDICDNGIGFDKQFTEKMFRIFQRLHNIEDGYDGKGIGLAICQRIMANHEGYMLASGATGAGATFKLFFPVE